MSDSPPSTAAMLFSAPDQVGIIARLANFFAERKVNISRYEEFTDAGMFFSRMEWPLNDRWETESDFAAEFAPLAEQYHAEFSSRFFNRKQSLGLFVSSWPHALVEILNKQEANFFPDVEISFIIGNDPQIQKIADRHATPFFHVETQGDALDWEREQLAIIDRYQPDLIGLARYMKVLSNNMLSRVSCPIVNIHHSFLPAFIGANPYKKAYERGVKLIGATSHFVTAELDQGPIIDQDVARVGTAASVEQMVRMGRDIEQKVFARALLKVLEYKAIVHQNRTIIFN